MNTPNKFLAEVYRFLAMNQLETGLPTAAARERPVPDVRMTIEQIFIKHYANVRLMWGFCRGLPANVILACTDTDQDGSGHCCDCCALM